MRKNRSVLLISQSIQQSNIIQNAIKLKNIEARTILQMKTDEDQIQDQIDCKYIIIATNVAGRGTDLKVSQELINEGGLHVIITFVPENLRVEMQARGRAARNGAPGSSEIIMNLTEYSKESNIPTIDRKDYERFNI